MHFFSENKDILNKHLKLYSSTVKRIVGSWSNQLDCAICVLLLTEK